MLTTTVSYRLLASDMTRSLARAAASPVVERESAYYLANIEKITSVDDFLADDRLYSFAMKAFGLGDMTYAKAFMRKALEGGISQSDSFANQIVDKPLSRLRRHLQFRGIRQRHDDLRAGPAGHSRQIRAPDAGGDRRN